MRKRKLWLCELLKRHIDKNIPVLINDGYYYDSILDCLQQIKDCYFWNANVKYWKIDNKNRLIITTTRR